MAYTIWYTVQYKLEETIHSTSPILLRFETRAWVAYAWLGQYSVRINIWANFFCIIFEEKSNYIILMVPPRGYISKISGIDCFRVMDNIEPPSTDFDRDSSLHKNK